MDSLLIKVCGMKHPENIRAILQTKPDWMGFIFYQQSPRAVSSIPTDISFGETKKIGVFVNESIEQIQTMATDNQLDGLQLHGEESPEQCYQLQNNGWPVIKAISVRNEGDIQRAMIYMNCVDYFLFDTKSEEARGGTGKKFDWQLINTYSGQVPFLLSGGIGPSDIEQIQSIKHHKLVGVDVNSGFETEPGKKDVNQIKSFIQTLRSKQ